MAVQKMGLPEVQKKNRPIGVTSPHELTGSGAQLERSMSIVQKRCQKLQSRDNWAYPYQRTPMEKSLYKPYIEGIYGL